MPLLAVAVLVSDAGVEVGLGRSVSDAVQVIDGAGGERRRGRADLVGRLVVADGERTATA